MRVALALAAALSFSACPQPAKPPPPPRDGALGRRSCAPDPGRKNVRVPVLKRPFDGDWPLFNLFDHLTPGAFRPYDENASEQSFCGLDMLGLSEGHDGYAWGLAAGTPVLSAADGVVVHAGPDDEFFCPASRKTVKDQLSVQVLHDGLGGVGYITLYRHLAMATVAEGDLVKQGQRLGLSGRSGCATEPTLYFGLLRTSGTKSRKPAPVDPYGWEGPGKDPWAEHAFGARSVYLWMDGEAPSLEAR